MTWYVQIESYSATNADKKIYYPFSTIWSFDTEKEAAAFLRKAARLPFKSVSLTKWSDSDVMDQMRMGRQIND